MRYRCYRTVRDGDGNVLLNSLVEVLVPGTSQRTTSAVYVGSTGEAKRGSWHFCPDGVVDFSLDQPESVDIRIVPLDRPGSAPIVWPSQWVGS